MCDTYWFQLIQSVIGLIDPNKELVKCMLELSKMQEGVFELFLAFDHATQ